MLLHIKKKYEFETNNNGYGDHEKNDYEDIGSKEKTNHYGITLYPCAAALMHRQHAIGPELDRGTSLTKADPACLRSQQADITWFFGSVCVAA